MKIYRIVEDLNDWNNYFFESDNREECERMLNEAFKWGCEGEIAEVEIPDWHNEPQAA